MVDTAPLEEILLLPFAPSNVESVAKIMRNPMRDFGKLNIQAVESLGSSVLATQGDPNQLPIAMTLFLMERLEDPVTLLKILMGLGMYGGKTWPINP